MEVPGLEHLELWKLRSPLLKMRLGLCIVLHKTEALSFHGLPKNRKPPLSWLSIGEERIRIRASLKYLGLVLDSRLSFKFLFETLAPKVEKARYLGRILPNIFGPGYKTRKLYANVLNSIIMYGAPIWASCKGKREKASLVSMQRPITIRVARAY